MKKPSSSRSRAWGSPAAIVLAVLAVAAGAHAALGQGSATPDPAVVFSTTPPAQVTGTIDLAGTAAAASGVSRVEVRVDDGPYQLATGTTSWSLPLDTSLYPDGAHDVKARVTAVSGAQAWADLSIVLANRALLGPRLSIASPAANAKVKEELTVTGTASAPKGIARVEIRLDQGAFRAVSGRGSWSAKVDTLQLVDGEHTLTTRVTDADGQQATVSRTIVVDNQRRQIYWGALVSGKLYGYGNAPYDMRSLRVFERHTGKGVSILALGTSWGAPHPGFPAGAMTTIRDHGSIPLFSWGSMRTATDGADQSAYRLANITAGKFDGYITRFARAAKAWGHPFFLRFDWEMNLQSWYPWVEKVNGNHPGDFVKAWRHVHNIFTRVGATNVTWVWCPNDEYQNSIKPLSSLYPGDKYVDWTCIDGYNWGRNPWRQNIWQTFPEVIGPTYQEILSHVAPSKPMMIGETASSEYGGSKAQWIRQTLSVDLPQDFPHIKAFVWFNVRDKADWEIETSAAATSAFRASIRSRYFAANVFKLLGSGKIRPLP